MEDEGYVGELLASLDSAATPEKRMAALQSIQTYIAGTDELHQTDQLTSSLKTQLRNQNHLVSSLVLSILPVYASKLVAGQHHSKAQDVKTLVQAILSTVLEKMGDHKEKVRDGARAVIIEFANAAFSVSTTGGIALAKDSHSAAALFEKIFKESGLLAKSAKIKEQSTLTLVPLKKAIDKFPLRPFLPSLVDQLSDADPGVREAARGTCINLFSSATATAKAELKKEMEKKLVRKQTADAILAQVLGGTMVEDTAVETKSTLSPPQRSRELPPRSQSRMGQAGKADDGIEAVYIASQSDLERTLTAMLPHFEGKETEHNWLAREQSVVKLRGMLRTGVHDSFYDVFLHGLKNIHEGILKATASLRTTLSMHALQLISELAQRMREGIDSLAEPLMSSIIKMAGFTKKIVASASQAAIRELLIHVSYRHKFLDLLWQNLQEKTVTTRAFMCGHLITILQTHGSHRRHLLEGHGGLDVIERFCKKALPDQNKDVREKAREALYLVERIWPAAGMNIIESLDAATRKQVESNRGKVAEVAATSIGPTVASVPRPVATPTTTPRRGPNGPSNAIVAAKRAAAARLAQERRNQEEAEGAMMLQDEEEGGATSSDPFGAKKQLQREADNEEYRDWQETPVKPAVVSFPSMKTPRSPPGNQVSLESGHHKARSLSPSSIPLPVSPHRSANSLLVGQSKNSSLSPSSSPPSSQYNPQVIRPRTSSTSSSSSVRSTGRLGSTATPSANGRFESFGQRVGQNTKSLATPTPSTSRVRTISTASSSSSSQRGRVPGASPSLRARDITSLSSSSSPRHMARNEEVDETIQLDQFPDASMDLLSGSTEVDYQAKSSPESQRIGQRDGSKTRLSPLPSNHATPIASTLKTPSSSGRSRLPRPVSVIYSSPSPAVVLPSRHTHSRSIDAAAPVSPSLLSASAFDALSLQAKPELEQLEVLSADLPVQAALQQPITQEVEQQRSSSSAVKWFLGKALRLDHAQVDKDLNAEGLDVQLSPIKKRPESETYISHLQSGQADVRTFKGLARICKEFKLPDCADEDDLDDDEPMLQPGMAFPTSSSNQSRREEQIAMTMWQQGNLFERLYSALSAYLTRELSSISKDLKTAALIVLHRLVENQFKLFKALGKQGELIQLIFDLIRSNKSSNVKSACQAIMESWSEQTNVIVGISTLRGILSTYLGTQVDVSNATASTTTPTTPPADSSTSFLISIHTLSLRSLSRLFQRLPVELIEEEVERCKAILKTGLNHWNIETRQQAVAVLVAANSKVKDPKSIFLILQPMDRAQEDLLMYFMSRAEHT